MSLSEVKEFMRKKLPRELVQSKRLSNERPAYYRSNHVIDLPKKGENPDKSATIGDESGLHLTNDVKSHPFSLIDEYFANRKLAQTAAELSSLDDDSHSDTVVSLIKKPPQMMNRGKYDESLEVIRRMHGSGLYEFMRDKKSGKLNKKYDKVFIC